MNDNETKKKTFMQSEGDAWFARNKERVASRKLPESDPLLCEILEIHPRFENMSVLEIGCGDGSRLAWLKKSINADCCGIEPSANAAACAKGLNVCQGPADELPYIEAEHTDDQDDWIPVSVLRKYRKDLSA